MVPLIKNNSLSQVSIGFCYDFIPTFLHSIKSLIDDSFFA